MSRDGPPKAGILLHRQKTGRMGSGFEPRSRSGGAQGRPAELAVADLETLAGDLVRRVGLGRLPFLMALLEEAAAEAAPRDGMSVGSPGERP
jgi:hypothetical protein